MKKLLLIALIGMASCQKNNDRCYICSETGYKDGAVIGQVSSEQCGMSPKSRQAYIDRHTRNEWVDGVHYQYVGTCQ